MKRALLLMMVLTGCTSAFERVKKAHHIRAARDELNGYEPSIVKLGPDAEAWYFGKTECVLFVNGRLVQSKSSRTEKTGDNVKPSEEEAVLCRPSEL